jgi:peroxiredoxin (alkyl hydroperoxide reductase subunit C)
VQVLSCSIDTIFTHKIWDETELSKLVKGGIPYPMLWDVGGNIGRMYGVYDEKSGLNGRGVFIIDPDGNIQALEIVSNSLGRNFDETLRQVRALQHIRNSKGTEAVPTGWEPGGQTLKPGAELVGHVCEIWRPKK